MNGKAEKQQGREAAGGFRATIEGFPLLEKEPRAYGKREKEREREQENESEGKGEREKRWSTRQKEGVRDDHRKQEKDRDRTRGEEREGERKERDHRLVDPAAIILYQHAEPVGFAAFPGPSDNTTRRSNRSPTRSLPRPPLSERESSVEESSDPDRKSVV